MKIVEGQIVILYRKDLKDSFKKLKIEKIEFDHFNVSMEYLYKSSIVMFVDFDWMKTKILKNIWGHLGGNRMIFSEKTTVLFREDLLERNKNLEIENVEVEHFNLQTEYLFKSDLILFIVNGKTKVLKNRWGNVGIL